MSGPFAVSISGISRQEMPRDSSNFLILPFLPASLVRTTWGWEDEEVEEREAATVVLE